MVKPPSQAIFLNFLLMVAVANFVVFCFVSITNGCHKREVFWTLTLPLFSVVDLCIVATVLTSCKCGIHFLASLPVPLFKAFLQWTGSSRTPTGAMNLINCSLMPYSKPLSLPKTDSEASTLWILVSTNKINYHLN